ncbi:divalent-cation tolerance protein CutA [bacterium]|nr:divalent-cation tolerance protein CutA [bacterium]
MSELLEVHTTFAKIIDATEICRKLVDERLAACAQMIPGVTSIYYWDGRTRRDSELLVLIKTTKQAWPALRDRLKELHPFDEPEIIAVPVEDASQSYADWVSGYISGRASAPESPSEAAERKDEEGFW